MGKKIISFSLWGNIRLYCIGAIKNALLAKKIFPEWICRYYYDNSVPEIIINYLKSLDNTELIYIEKPSGGVQYKYNGTFGSLWRFLVCIDPNVDIYLVCDTDSRLNLYLKNATEILFTKKYNFIRFVDLPSNYPIIACGFIGLQNAVNFNSDAMLKFNDGKFYCDQEFLKEIIFPQICNTCLTLPRKHHKNPELFVPKITGTYVGQVVDEYDVSIDKNGNQAFNFKNNYYDLNELLKSYKILISNLN